MKLLRTKHRRLSTRLAIILLLTLIAVMVFATVAAALTAYFEAGDIQDEILLSVAQLVETNQIQTLDSESLWRDHEYDDGVQVWQLGVNKRRVLPIKNNIKHGYHTVKGKGSLWRVYVTSNPESGNRYAISQKLSVKTEVALNSAANTALPLLGLLLFIPLIIYFVVRYSFRPLNQLSEKVSSNNSLALDLSNRTEIPVEVVPFVDSIDNLLHKNARYNQKQKRFIADAAHELRTPITALSLEIENLARARDDETRLTRQATIERSVDRLQRLVNQLLDLARVQSGGQNTKSIVSLNELVKNQIADFFVLAENKNIELIVEKNEPAYLEDVQNQLQHLIRNALSNAVKYTPDGGEIRVSVTTAREEVTFRVIDTGPGVDSKYISRLSEPFYRPVEHATSKGAGLGLAICHEIASTLNGVLSLTNLPQGGMQFLYTQTIASKNPQSSQNR